MANQVNLYMGSTAYSVPVAGQTFDHGMSDAWVANATTQYNAMMGALSDISYSGVPFFVTTDQHGKGTGGNQWLANTDVSVKNVSLGDWCGDIFGPVAMGELAEKTAGIPNFMAIPGNHDFKKNVDNPANYNTINNSFHAVDGRRHSQYGYYSVKNTERNVKWVVVQPYVIDLDTTAGFRTVMTTEQTEWLIRELSVDDGYDIVLVQHMPLYGSGYSDRDGNTYSPEDFSNCDITQMLKHRISGSTGSFTDSDGIAHAYDFSDLQGRFLCTLHGHMHTEMWRTTDGLVSFCGVGYLTGYASTFGLIDRLNNKLMIWRFDDTTAYDVLEIPLNQQ